MKYWGIFTGFYGYLLLGNINLAMVELSKEKSIKPFIRFLVIVLIFESVYLYASILGFYYILRQQKYISIVQFIGAILTISIGIWGIFSKPNTSISFDNRIVSRAYFSAIIHPQQILFWLVWLEILRSNGLNMKTDIFQFIVFNAFGAMMILILYAKFGQILITKIKSNTQTIARIIGIVYIFLGIYQLKNLYF